MTNDCCAGSTPGLKSFEEALDQLLSRARPVTATERIALDQALGRVLAESVVSRVDVPPWDNSAMDGYAVCVADLRGPGARLPVSQRITAGCTGAPLQSGTAARIFTGAPVPPGADAVVPQELCRREGDEVVVDAEVAEGANVRRAGEDLESGQEVIGSGTLLRPQHLGLAASVGVSELRVYRRIRVAVLTSGDELVMPGATLAEGQIYNSNHFTFGGLLQALGCEVLDLGQVEDSLEATCAALLRGAQAADLVLASGGVSVGEEDHVKPAVEHLGSLDLWKIAIRPGKPLAFGHIGGTPFIGTPGNPVSLFVTFCLLARPFILRMQGCSGMLEPPRLWVEADFDWTRPGDRRELARARMEVGPDGQARVSVYHSRSSGVLSSVAWANGLAIIPENRVIHRGDRVQFIPFTELLA